MSLRKRSKRTKSSEDASIPPKTADSCGGSSVFALILRSLKLTSEMGSCGTPAVCLICYFDLNTSNNQSPGKSVKKLEDVIFTLKTLLLVPSLILEGWILETKTTPEKWISLCKICGEAVEQARQIYEEISETTRRFEEVRGKMREKVRRSWRVSEGIGKGKGKEVLKVTNECRKYISRGLLEQSEEMEEDFLVPSVPQITANLLSSVPFPRRVYQIVLSGTPTPAPRAPATPIKVEPDNAPRNFKEYEEPASLETQDEEGTVHDDYGDNVDDDPLDFLNDAIETNNVQEHDAPPTDAVFNEMSDEKMKRKPEDDAKVVETSVSADTNASVKPPPPKRRPPPPGGRTEPRFKCEYCDKRFYSSHKRLQHKQLVHHDKPLIADRMPVQCPLCQKTLAHVRALKAHLRSLHKGQPVNPKALPRQQIPCPWEDCDKVYSDQGGLKVHLSRHEGKPMFPCKQCDAAYYTWQDLARHKNASHDKLTFECDICGNVLASKSGAQIHKKTVHGEQRKQYLVSRRQNRKSRAKGRKSGRSPKKGGGDSEDDSSDE